MKNIGVLGCGWLGLPLAKTLVGKNFTVKGSTTSQNKLGLLKENGIDAFLISISETQIKGDIDGFLNDLDTVIIDVPPKASESDFTKKIQILVPSLEKSGTKKVIFISSTSVYDDQTTIVTEATPTNPNTESGRQLVISERLLSSNTNFKTTIIRFGGLIGEDRHPVKFLSGRKNNENPDSPINLIHQKDCIGIILRIIEMEIYGEIFNAVAPFHPTRKDYYTEKARTLNLALPEFADQKTAIGKTISSEKIEKKLGYHFAIPNL
jgi:nucleoside-diphosphate-sugar epimerase